MIHFMVMSRLDYIQSTLQKHPQEMIAIEELNKVKGWLQSLPVTKEEYGLIHYDFQLDNLFYEEGDSRFIVIDFDDSHYNWYAMDIVTALMDLYENPHGLLDDQMDSFLRGYRSITPLDQVSASRLPAFYRFARLYGFTRKLAALENSKEVAADAHSWYDGLRARLEMLCEQDRLLFKEPC